jgi:septal ring factor EnvC (AmiA/AmiB activator)
MPETNGEAEPETGHVWWGETLRGVQRMGDQIQELRGQLSETKRVLTQEIEHKDKLINDLLDIRERLRITTNDVENLQRQLDKTPAVVVMSEKKIAKLRAKAQEDPK